MTLTVQVPFTGTLAQLFDSAKFDVPELMPTPVNMSVFVPVLVTVTVCTALVELICCAAKVSALVDTLAKPEIPVDAKEADCWPAPVATTS